MKYAMLLISIATVILVVGLSYVSAADLDSNGSINNHDNTLSSGIGGGEYTPFYSCGFGFDIRGNSGYLDGIGDMYLSGSGSIGHHPSRDMVLQ